MWFPLAGTLPLDVTNGATPPAGELVWPIWSNPNIGPLAAGLLLLQSHYFRLQAFHHVQYYGDLRGRWCRVSNGSYCSFFLGRLFHLTCGEVSSMGLST